MDAMKLKTQKVNEKVRNIYKIMLLTYVFYDFFFGIRMVI
jgi:hypothetical protein